MSSATRTTVLFIGVLFTLLGLIGGVTVWLTAVEAPTQIVVRPGDEEETAGDRPPEGGQIIIIENKRTATDATFLLPLLLTAVGSLISLGSLWLNWRQDERLSEQDQLELELLRLELALKRRQLADSPAPTKGDGGRDAP